MEVLIAHEPVVLWWMVLGEVVRHINLSLSPKDLELFLLDSVMDPEEPHIERLGELTTHGGVEQPCGSCVIIIQRSTKRRLFVAEFGESGTNRTCLLGCQEDAASLSFCSGSHDIF